MKKVRNIIHQILNKQKLDKQLKMEDSSYIDKNILEKDYQHMLPGGKVIITIYLN